MVHGMEQANFIDDEEALNRWMDSVENDVDDVEEAEDVDDVDDTEDTEDTEDSNRRISDALPFDPETYMTSVSVFTF